MSLIVEVPELKKSYTAKPGSTLLEVLQHHHTDIAAPCGGKGTCKKCTVNVEKLGTVLACELKVDEALWERLTLDPSEHLVVHLPVRTQAQFAAGGILPKVSLNPIICRAEVTLPPASLADPRSDESRFETAASMNVPLALLNDLNGRMTGQSQTLFYDFRTDTQTVVRFVDSPDNPTLGCAIDLGTTTLAAYLYDLVTGRKLAQTSRMNPQKSFGADVISRIEYASISAENRLRLQTSLCDELTRMIEELVAKIQPGRPGQHHLDQIACTMDDVLVITLAGNTTMMHLLCALNPERIARAPFLPVSLQGRVLPAEAIGIGLNKSAIAVLLPSVASYVGADITAGVLTCRLHHKLPASHKSGETGSARILLDIGTNGEVVLSGPQGLVACATAAGPAFEGAEIACGMPALTGAIDQATFEDGKLSFSSLGGEVRGICGSGLVALVAALLDAGLIDETGRLMTADELDETISAELKGQLGKIGQQTVFYLSGNTSIDSDAVQHESGDLPTATTIASPVYLCQKDIRELQNAKAALAAGLLVLIDRSGLRQQDIGELFLAGGFGNYLNIEQAIRIGLLPESLFGKIKTVGNSSGLGASLCLLDDDLRLESEKIARDIHYLELSGDSLFSELYIDSMIFP